MRRITLRRQGQLLDQVDITYRPDEIAGWFPTSWVRNQYAPGGAVRRTTKIEVLEVRFNEPQPAEQFDVVFPTGTTVIDDRNDLTFYRVQPDGSMREVSPSGEVLSASIAQPGDSWYRRNRWILACLGMALVGLVLAGVLKRRRRTGSS